MTDDELEEFKFYYEGIESLGDYFSFLNMTIDDPKLDRLRVQALEGIRDFEQALGAWQ